MRLYITEKPSVARELAACLRNPRGENGFITTDDGIVTWLFGHILQQAEPQAYDSKYKNWRLEDLPIIPKIWKMEINPTSFKQFELVKKLISRADEIVHAGDPDREGQLLVDEVLDFVGNQKPVKRILLNALDKTSILRANENLRDNKNFFNLKQSALARSRADWLIGMNLSRAYTLIARRYGHKNLLLPIGRVKTPTLALVVRREREIQNFKPTNFFNIFGIFSHEGNKFTATFKPSKKLLNSEFFDVEGRLINKNFAEALIKKFSVAPFEGKIFSCKTTEKKELQPLPFSLSTLQIAAGKIFGYTPKLVLETAQTLYEKKLTTYPRSDCEFLPTNQFKDAKIILKNLMDVINTDKKLFEHANTSIKSRAWNNSKITAHHAIIPTQKKLSLKLSVVESNIYRLIARNYAVQFYLPCVFDETNVMVKYKEEDFLACGKVIKQRGWHEFYINTKTKDESEKNLPTMKKNDVVVHKTSKLKESVTKPPMRFTPSELVQGMKNIYKYVKNDESKKRLKDVYGIGTEATRAAIIEDLLVRDFLNIDTKKKLIPTEKAYLLIDALPDEMTYPDVTAIWEDKLHSMSEGNGKLEEFLDGQIEFIDRLCKCAINTSFKNGEKLFKCPRCGNALIKRQSKKGSFWGCSTYPKCRTTFEDEDGKPNFSKF